MDWKSTVFGIGLLASAFVLLSLNVREDYERTTQRTVDNEKTLADQQSTDISPPVSDSSTAASAILSPSASEEKAESEIGSIEDPEPEVLANRFVEAAFSRYGGGIQGVSLLKYPAVKGEPTPYHFRSSPLTPILGLSYSGDGLSLSPFVPEYTIVDKSESEITFRLDPQPGVVILRRYRLSGQSEGAAPYTIEHTTEFINNSQESFDIERLYMNIGVALPTDADPHGQYLNFGYYDGNKAHFTKRSAFKASSGILGMGGRTAQEAVSGEGSVVWASVKNQFFATVLTPKFEAQG